MRLLRFPLDIRVTTVPNYGCSSDTGASERYKQNCSVVSSVFLTALTGVQTNQYMHSPRNKWKQRTTTRFSGYLVPHHSDSIVQQGLAEHQDVQQLVDVDLLKHSEHSHGIHGRDDGGEQQARQQLYGEEARVIGLDLTHGVQEAPDEEGVPQGPHHGEHQDRAQVLHERADGQEVAGIQDDGRKQAEEEGTGVQHRGDLLSSHLDEPPHQQAHHNQQAAFWHNAGQTRNQVEPWENGGNREVRYN